MRIRISLASAAAMTLLLAAPAIAQPGNAPGRDLSAQDMHFVGEAATGGRAEVELGHLASQNAQDPQVKRFGERMVQDHGKANAQLTDILGREGIRPPTRLDPQQARLRDRLHSLRGAAFDRAYMQAMVKDHDGDIDAFRREAQNRPRPGAAAVCPRYAARH